MDGKGSHLTSASFYREDLWVYFSIILFSAPAVPPFSDVPHICNSWVFLGLWYKNSLLGPPQLPSAPPTPRLLFPSRQLHSSLQHFIALVSRFPHPGRIMSFLSLSCRSSGASWGSRSHVYIQFTMLNWKSLMTFLSDDNLRSKGHPGLGPRQNHRLNGKSSWGLWQWKCSRRIQMVTRSRYCKRHSNVRRVKLSDHQELFKPRFTSSLQTCWNRISGGDAYFQEMPFLRPGMKRF